MAQGAVRMTNQELKTCFDTLSKRIFIFRVFISEKPRHLLLFSKLLSGVLISHALISFVAVAKE